MPVESAAMSSLVKPSVKAFLVCDYVMEDSFTKKKSVIGIFTHLQAAGFPFQHHHMGLYFCITDAEGSYQFDLSLVYLNTEQVVAKAQLPIVEIQDRLQIADFCVTLTNLLFPGPGRYEFRLFVNGQLLAQKDFTVTQMAAPQDTQA